MQLCSLPLSYYLYFILPTDYRRQNLPSMPFLLKRSTTIFVYIATGVALLAVEKKEAVALSSVVCAYNACHVNINNLGMVTLSQHPSHGTGHLGKAFTHHCVKNKKQQKYHSASSSTQEEEKEKEKQGRKQQHGSMTKAEK